MEELGAEGDGKALAGGKKVEPGKHLWCVTFTLALHQHFTTVFGKTQPELRRREPAQGTESHGVATSFVSLDQSFHLRGCFHLYNSGKILAIWVQPEKEKILKWAHLQKQQELIAATF